MIELPEREEWHDHAECADSDPELFFPERGADTRVAKAICAMCPVQHECLEWALQSGEKFGIWGGKSERERRTIRGQRNKSGTAPCAQCGTVFERSHMNFKLCSDECRRARRLGQMADWRAA